MIADLSSHADSPDWKLVSSPPESPSCSRRSIVLLLHAEHSSSHRFQNFPFQLQALERVATVDRTVLLAEQEVTSDIVKMHLKNFYPHVVLYTSQTWVLPTPELLDILSTCQVSLDMHAPFHHP